MYTYKISKLLFTDIDSIKVKCRILKKNKEKIIVTFTKCQHYCYWSVQTKSKNIPFYTGASLKNSMKLTWFQ